MPRAKQTMDGNTAAAHVAYAYTDVAAIYPITPSSPMADSVDQWSAAGQKNIFGNQVKVVEMESEAGAAGAVHGSLGAGAVTTTFTASQGLLLMIPNMYKIAAEQLPCVFDVSARTVATQSLNIFGDHSDVMACRQTGFAMLVESSVQEVMDLSPVAHLCAIEGKVPFLNFFDGFRTSHEYQKIEKWDYADLKEMCNMEAVEEFRKKALNPESPKMRGSHENGDVFFQHREACNSVYNALPAVVEKYMAKINAKLGTNYDLFNYYGAADADRVIVAMGSICDVADEVIDYLNAKGEKVGIIKVRLYRPWVSSALLKVLPKTAKKVAVLDRTKEPGSLGEPLYLDVAATLREAGLNDIVLTGGRYGLGSKDTPPSSIFALYKELEKDQPKERFTLGITDDVTFLSLPEVKPAPITAAAGTKECKFWGLGGDGTVGANKNSIKIIGETTDMYCQAYFEYDTKKSFGITKSHLRFGKHPISSTYYVSRADFVACHNQTYLTKYDIISELKPHGSFLLNCEWTEDQLEQHIPGDILRYIAENDIHFYIIDANKESQALGLGNRSNMVLQAAFFKLAHVIPVEDAVEHMKAAVKKTYGLKGEKVVNMNIAAVDAGINALVQVQVKPEWKNLSGAAIQPPRADVPDIIKNILVPINAQKGDDLPVSAFRGMEDGTMPLGTSQYEKRGIATHLPVWDKSECIQCNRCSFVCPHAVIRPYLLNEDEVKNAPAGLELTDAKGPQLAGLRYTMGVSTLDCTSCGSCVASCPKSGKALRMVPAHEVSLDQINWNYLQTIPEKNDRFDKFTLKGSQFRQPLVEFNGACAGCGETPYVKLLTQLFGDRMFLANATGCTQAWGAAMPCVPYCKNKEGKGPAWSNSLFENNAEFSYGMCLAVKQLRAAVTDYVHQLDDMTENAAVKAAIAKWLETYDDLDASTPATQELLHLLESQSFSAQEQAVVDEILKRRKDMSKKTMWMYGGDGWAYDIGYGGLDHVFAMGEDVNVLLVDTEVYSNTGGQASKASNIGQVAQFAAAGKEVKKKSLAEIAMQYGYVYVAQVAMGANPAQTIKAITEAEAYHGPSLIIGYSPCEMHSIKGGMMNCQKEMKKAVDCGYWNLFRFNPAAEKKFTLDSKAPAGGYHDFLMNEARYSRLTREFPDRASDLFARNEKSAMDRYQHLLKLKAMYDEK